MPEDDYTVLEDSDKREVLASLRDYEDFEGSTIWADMSRELNHRIKMSIVALEEGTGEPIEFVRFHQGGLKELRWLKDFVTTTISVLKTEGKEDAEREND